MKPKNKKLSLVIPALNELPIILKNIKEIKFWMSKNLSAINYEILIIDDGSTDGMERLLDQEAKKDKLLRVIHHQTN